MKKIFKRIIKYNRNIKKYVCLLMFLLVNIIKVFLNSSEYPLDLQIQSTWRREGTTVKSSPFYHLFRWDFVILLMAEPSYHVG